MKSRLEFKDFPKTQKVEINGIVRDIPELTEENFWTLINDYNKLIDEFNALLKQLEK